MTPLSRLNKIQITNLIERLGARPKTDDWRTTRRRFEIFLRLADRYKHAPWPGFFGMLFADFLYRNTFNRRLV